IEQQTALRIAALDECLRFIRSANEPTVLSEPVHDRLAEIAKLTYLDVDGSARPYLEPDELEALQIQRGTLTASERTEISNHVVHTLAFLQTIPWGRSLRNIPTIAAAHHESLEGSGYPFGLKGNEICIESRMLTISDIFDALTASDRPYKLAVPVPKALDILASEVERDKLDRALFDLFVSARVWERALRRV